jgi:hypothetical protein
MISLTAGAAALFGRAAFHLKHVQNCERRKEGKIQVLILLVDEYANKKADCMRSKVDQLSADNNQMIKILSN